MRTISTINYIFAILMLCGLLTISTLAAPGDLDPSFGSGGIVGSTNYYMGAIAVQPDGKIVADGDRLARYNANGSLDTTFGVNGFNNHYGLDYVQAVALQTDGKIVTAGYRFLQIGMSYFPEFFVTRYNTNGLIDPTFGPGGYAITSFGAAGQIPYALAIQPDGRILVAGTNYRGAGYGVALARYNNDGSLDITYGSGGKILSQTGPPDELIYALTIQADGKILAGGSALLRFNSDGSPDSTFGIGGRVLYGNPDDYLYAVAVQENGKIVTAGSSHNATGSSFGLTRYNPDGTIDNTFGSAGKVVTQFGNSDMSYAASLKIQPNGKIIAAGGGKVNGKYCFALAKYNSEGTLDQSFGSGGKVLTQISQKNDYVRTVTVLSDGKILASGVVDDTGDYSDDFTSSAIVRYLSTPLINVTNIEDLYAAVNNSANAGSQIIVAPGVYMLSATAPGGAARPNGGRLELQQDMSLTGTVGDRGAVVIDAGSLPASSYAGTAPVTGTGVIRVGRGSNAVEWLTIRNALSGGGGIIAHLSAPGGTANVRIAHVDSHGNPRGIDIRNVGAAATGYVINADIVDNDLYSNTRIPTGAGVRIVNIQGASGSVVTANLSGNRSYGNFNGILVENTGSTINGSITAFSTGDRFYENAAGGVVGGGLGTTSGNTTNFTATGTSFENNIATSTFDIGGLILLGGENTTVANGSSSNTANVELRNCRFTNNQLYDIGAFGARSNPISVGLPGTNNRVQLTLAGTYVPVMTTTDSLPDTPTGMNSVTVTRTQLASVSGRVLTPDGRGLRNATVFITDSQGVRRTVTTSSFGFFSFDNVVTGGTYAIGVSSRLYRFSSQTVQVDGNLTLADFVGLE